MATLNVIRRWALRDQMSIREISRRTGLARNTIKKHLRSEESEPKLPEAGQLMQARSLRREAGHLAGNRGNKIAETAAYFEADPHNSTQKGENQELTHIVSTLCSQRVWVKIRWKTRVRLQRNSTIRDFDS